MSSTNMATGYYSDYSHSHGHSHGTTSGSQFDTSEDEDIDFPTKTRQQHSSSNEQTEQNIDEEYITFQNAVNAGELDHMDDEEFEESFNTRPGTASNNTTRTTRNTKTSLRLVVFFFVFVFFFLNVMDLHRANVYLAQLGLCNF